MASVTVVCPPPSARARTLFLHISANRNSSVLRVVSEMLAGSGTHCKSHSQWKEDIQLYPLLSCAARIHGAGKSFVELGAFDGVTHSNTYMLEKCYGWSGLLLEASPANYALLRSSSNRTATMIHTAVCDTKTGSVDVSVNSGEFGGETALMQSANFKKFAHKKNLTRTARVRCSPLEDLMARSGMSSGATWLSLDVEGAEAKVLETVDPAVFKVIMVETFQPLLGWRQRTREDDEHNERVAGLITRAGLTRVPSLGNRINHVFVRADVMEHCLHHHLSSRMKSERKGQVQSGEG